MLGTSKEQNEIREEEAMEIRKVCALCVGGAEEKMSMDF